MSETARQTDLNKLREIYATLNKQDVEQFYAGYQSWNLQQRSVTLQEQIKGLHREITANAELMEMVHPPAIALATMARLQASGVNDIDLLDRMLERGEGWLDRTMQRLDYCEQLDFILNDYTQWCQNALEGAYDWIDSMRENGTASSTEAPTGDTSTEATEKLILQKLASEEVEQSPSPETTLDLSPSALEEPPSVLEGPPTIFSEELVSTPQEHAAISEETQGIVKTSSDLEEPMLESQEEQPSQMSQVSQPIEVSPASNSPVEAIPISTEQTVQEETSTTESPLELSPTSNSEQFVSQEYSNPSIDEASESEQLISQVYIEFDPAPEEQPPAEGDDGSDFRQFPMREHTIATEKALLTKEESPMYWEESLPYRMYSSDKQPSIQAERLEDAEQGIPVTIQERRRNFLQRLAARIWRR